MSTATELRRTREKLKILTTTPYIQWILNDIIDAAADWFAGWDMDDMSKIAISKELKEKYERFITDNTQPPPEQISLKM